VELPAPLRQAIDDALISVSSADLSEATQNLSAAYRGAWQSGKSHLADDRAVRAYLAARMPATYAAIRASLEALSDVLPDFAPRTLLDAGAGPGTALFAAGDCWPNLQSAVLIERSRAMRAAGEMLAARATPQAVTWIDADFAAGTATAGKAADLVTASYFFNELAPDSADGALDQLWAHTGGVLLLVEPGTPAGWALTMRLRERLIALGAHILAPCPHARPCPLTPPDWCHFAQRVARSRMHRLAKEAEVPWEDEKFIYLAASRREGLRPAARVIAPPRRASGQAELKLCRADGAAATARVTRRDKEAYRVARRLHWGDAWPAGDAG
jgi:ribosomal protein RSM22 (predicted rRNA methylase)